MAARTHRLPAAPLEAVVVDALRRTVETSDPPGTAGDSPFDAQPSGSPLDSLAQTSAVPARRISTQQAQALVGARLVRLVVLPDRFEIDYHLDSSDRSTTRMLSVPWIKPPSRVRRILLEPKTGSDARRPMESDERNRLIRGIATARSWVQALVKGSIADIAELARRENRTPRSIRMRLSLAFLDPALVEAACAGTVPRGYGVTRFMALGLSRPI